MPAARSLHELRGLDALEAGLDGRGEAPVGSAAAADVEFDVALSLGRGLRMCAVEVQNP